MRLSIVFMESIPYFFILLLLTLSSYDYSILYNKLSKETGKRQSPPFRAIRKEGDIMSTYEEFMIILTACSLLIAILNYTHRK